MRKTVTVLTSCREELIDITPQIITLIEQTGFMGGYAMIFIPHTTAGLTINENADPDVRRDMIQMMQRLIPSQGDYRHREGNAAAHMKASLLGFSQTIFIAEGRPQLGTWQSVYLAEFDGPRSRQIWVKFIAD